MIYVGDIHGEFKKFIANLEKNDIWNDNIIQVGDFGLGFDTIKKDSQNLNLLNQIMEERNCNLYAIRGNHDDPWWFDEKRNDHDESRIILVEDGEILTIENKKVLFVGGAISIDRSQRTRNKSYWEKEIVEEDIIYNLDDNLEVDVVVTHTAPSFAYPVTLNRMVYEYIEYEKNHSEWKKRNLEHELKVERALMDVLHSKVKDSVKEWYYGHYHNSVFEERFGIKYRLLGIHEIYDDNAHLYKGQGDITMI